MKFKMKKALNMKSLTAKAEKEAKEALMEKLEARRREEEEWLAWEEPKSRAALKREEKAEKRAMAVARKAETRMLEEKEEDQVLSKKQLLLPVKAEERWKIMTAEEWRKYQDKLEKAAKQREYQENLEKLKLEEQMLKGRRMMTGKQYMKMVDVMNTNRSSHEDEEDSIDEEIDVDPVEMYHLPAAATVEIRGNVHHWERKMIAIQIARQNAKHNKFDSAVC